MLNYQKQVKKELIKLLYKKSFYEFVKDFWQYADPSKFVDSELIEYYCEVFQYMARSWWDYKPVEINLEHLKGKIIDVRENKQNLNLVVPPRHSKSMIFNVLGGVWLWSLQPVKVVSVSHTQALASQMNSKRQAIINSPLFQSIFDNIKLTMNTTSFLKDSRGGELYSINRNAFTGYGGDVIINDDLTNAETARKDKEEMNNAWSYYRNTMPSRINNPEKSIVINIQQRLAPNDITGHILSDLNLKNQYTFITLPAIFKETTHLVFPISGKIKTFNAGDVLWKERFGNYDKLRFEVGESVFETQYLQNPIASDKAVIKQDLIRIKSEKEVPPIEDAELVFAAHDFPIKEKEDSDFVGSVLAYKIHQTIYITNALEKRMAFVKSVEYIEFLNQQFPGIIQIIEDKANGTPIIQQLQDRVPGIQAYNPKTASKTQRLESASLYMESSNIVFVANRYDEQSGKYLLNANLDNLVKRLLSFPYVKYDDIVDAFSMLVLYVFLDKRNNVYARSFNSKNVIFDTPDKVVSYLFINKVGRYFKVSQIGINYSTNTLYVLNELEIKGNELEVANAIKSKFASTKYLIDTSATPLGNKLDNLILEQIEIKDFHASIVALDSFFVKKEILIHRNCRRTISDIESFKWDIKKDENVTYITEQDGFVRNIRGAMKFLGKF